MTTNLNFGWLKKSLIGNIAVKLILVRMRVAQTATWWNSWLYNVQTTHTSSAKSAIFFTQEAELHNFMQIWKICVPTPFLLIFVNESKWLYLEQQIMFHTYKKVMAAYRRVDDLRSPAGWLPVHRDQLRAQRSVPSIGSLYLLLLHTLERAFGFKKWSEVKWVGFNIPLNTL